ncbi:hypothetical protein [Demequina phytophila]|uniref:hypothetical protein n=1 Tax=Demequina phytophila TaxID=1638981 RepID=UPI000785EA06|nr:hypothetical protein [Demequina phytophila]
MMDQLTAAAAEHGARMAARLEAAGTAPALAGITRARRRRVAGGAAILIPALALGAWAVTTVVGADPVEPATTDTPVEITEDPLDIQLSGAIGRGDYPTMQALIDLGVYLDHQGNRPFTATAMENCDVTAFQILEEAGAPRTVREVWRYDDEALRVAIGRCDSDVIARIVDPVTAPRLSDTTMLQAVDKADDAALTVLVSAGAPLEGAGDWSTVAYAALHGLDDRVDLLLDLGADPDVTIDEGPLIDYVREHGSARAIAAVEAAREAS